MDNGFILIHRKLLEWEWYSSVNDTRLFIHCLLKANWKDGKFKGVDIPRGSFVTSIRKLAKETGLSVKQVRVSLEHLKMTHELAHTTTSKYSIITINKYNDYQIDGTQIDNQRANKGQTKGNNRIKERKEIKEINIKEKYKKEKIEEIYFESLRVNSIFNEFLELRKKLKAVNSDRAINTLINKLNKYDEETQYKMIEQSIVNSWKDVYELKENKNKEYSFIDMYKELSNE